MSNAAPICLAARGNRPWLLSRIHVSARCGSKNQDQWTMARTRSSLVTSPGRENARWSRTFGSSPPRATRSDLDRVADPQPLPQPIGLVVGELVDHRERPHLEGEQARVPALRPREEHRQRERAGRGRGDRHPGRDPQAATGQRDDEGRRKRRRGRRPDHGPQRRGPSTARDPEAQGAASVYAAPPDRRRAASACRQLPPC